MNIRQVVTVVLLASGLAGCGMVDTMIHAFEYQKAVESDLQEAVGVKPDVSFNMKNAYLSVTVIFPDIRHPPKSMDELADTVRAVVTKDFKKAPDALVIGFAVSK